jgi:hypothetical protein
MTEQQKYLLGIKSVFNKIGKPYCIFNPSDYENINDMPHYSEPLLINTIYGVNTRNCIMYVSTMTNNGQYRDDSIKIKVNEMTSDFMYNLYENVYNYNIGEEEMTSDEFLDMVLETKN